MGPGSRAIQAEEGGGRCLRARARRAWVPCGPGKQGGARAAELAVAWGLARRDRRALGLAGPGTGLLLGRRERVGPRVLGWV